MYEVSVFTFVCAVLASLCSLYTGNKLGKCMIVSHPGFPHAHPELAVGTPSKIVQK